MRLHVKFDFILNRHCWAKLKHLCCFLRHPNEAFQLAEMLNATSSFCLQCSYSWFTLVSENKRRVHLVELVKSRVWGHPSELWALVPITLMNYTPFFFWIVFLWESCRIHTLLGINALLRWMKSFPFAPEACIKSQLIMCIVSCLIARGSEEIRGKEWQCI